MAFKYNGVEPTAIKYNGTDLTVLKYGDTAVWGKPFSLTFQISYGSEVGIHRDSSPNQHARIGNLGSGATVYYGDTLTITATPASGYKLTKFTINGAEYASGQTSSVSQTITVTGAVTVVTAAESAASWHTAWTGSKTYSFTTLQPLAIWIPPIALNRNYAINNHIRVTASSRYQNNYSAVSVQVLRYNEYSAVWTAGGVTTKVATMTSSSSSGETISFGAQSSSISFTRQWTITKIEYYY